MKSNAFLRFALLPALGVVNLVGCGGGTSTSPSTSIQPTGRIAYSQFEATSGEGRSDIYLRNADGSGLQRLTPANFGDFNSYPVIAPDGSRVAFVSSDAAATDIYVVKSDGTDLRRITNDAQRETSLNWTTDGRDLIYAANVDDQSLTLIYRVRADGSGTVSSAPQRVFGDSITRYNPKLAPDGRTLAYVTNDADGAPQIFLSNASGTGTPRQVTSGELRGSILTFTPDSQRLVYAFLPPSNLANVVFRVINLDGTSAPDLPLNSYNSGGVAFSPDGNYIAYSASSFDASPGASEDGLNDKILVTRADGTGTPIPLAPVDVSIRQFGPSWGR